MFKRSRKRVKVAPFGASLTEQKWRDRQDVNSIVARCLRGDTSGLKTCGFTFTDVSEYPKTLQDALNKRIECDRIFDTLSPEAREHFRSPSGLVNALNDENQRPYFEKFGLLKKAEAEPSPVKVEVINPVTPEGAA